MQDQVIQVPLQIVWTSVASSPLTSLFITFSDRGALRPTALPSHSVVWQLPLHSAEPMMHMQLGSKCCLTPGDVLLLWVAVYLLELLHRSKKDLRWKVRFVHALFWRDEGDKRGVVDEACQECSKASTRKGKTLEIRSIKDLHPWRHFFWQWLLLFCDAQKTADMLNCKCRLRLETK